MLAQPDTELREPSHSSEDQVSGSDTVLGTHNRRSATLNQPFSSWRAMTMRWIWLVPS
jgi:hypothetical protein